MDLYKKKNAVSCTALHNFISHLSSDLMFQSTSNAKQNFRSWTNRDRSVKTGKGESIPKGDLWVQSPMIIVGQSPSIRSIAELSAGRSPAIYRIKRIVGLCPLGRA